MVIQVKVKTGQKESEFTQDQATLCFLAKLKSSPVKNAANLELIALVAKYFKVDRSQVSIKTGLKSKIKRLEIP